MTRQPQIGEKVRIVSTVRLPYHKGPYKIIGWEDRVYSEVKLVHLEHYDENAMWRWPKVFPWDIEPWDDKK